MQANFLDTQTSNVLYRQKVYFAFVKQRLLCLRVLLIRLGYASSTVLLPRLLRLLLPPTTVV